MKRTLIAILAVLLCTAGASAQTFLSVNNASDAQTLATGGTGCRSAAAFALDGRKADAGISYMRLNPKVAETSVLNADASALIGRLGVSVRYRSFREEPVSFTDGDGALTGSFRPRESLAGIGAAWKITERLAAGAGINGISIRYSEALEASTLGADIFAAYSGNGIEAQLSVDNIGGKLYFGQGEAQALPTTARLRGTYSTSFGLNACAEADYILDGGFMAGVGAEYVFDGTAALRAGWHYGNSILAIQSYASAGLGLFLGKTSVDLTILFGSETFEGSLMAGIRYGF